MSVGGDHNIPGARRGNETVPRGVCAVRTVAVEHAEFREYVAARSATLLRMAYLLTGHRADAEDLVQVALAKTYMAWNRIQDRRAVDGYVRRAMVNTHISWWRQRRLEEYPTEHIPEQAAPDHVGDSDVHDALWRALARLPPRMRAAVALRFYEDMTEAEIACVLGVSVGTVKSTISRAVAKLRIDTELIGDFGDYVPRRAMGIGRCAGAQRDDAECIAGVGLGDGGDYGGMGANGDSRAPAAASANGAAHAVPGPADRDISRAGGVTCRPTP